MLWWTIKYKKRVQYKHKDSKQWIGTNNWFEYYILKRFQSLAYLTNKVDQILMPHKYILHQHSNLEPIESHYTHLFMELENQQLTTQWIENIMKPNLTNKNQMIIE